MFKYSFTNAGQVDEPNREVKMSTDSSLAVITAAGWINNAQFAPDELLPTDHIAMNYGINGGNPGGTYTVLIPVFATNGQITLVEERPSGEVTYTGALIAGDFANWNNTTGTLVDSGYSPSDASKTKVVMLSASPTIANYIACFSDTAGTIKNGSALAINPGSIQAGLSGTAGALFSMPPTPSTGSLSLTAAPNSGNFAVTITNRSIGQGCNFFLPDPGTAGANLLIAAVNPTIGHYLVASGVNGQMVDSGAKIFGGTTGLWAGGGVSHDFPVTNMVAGDVITGALLFTSTNVSTVYEAFAGAGVLSVFFSVDPGANTSVRYGGLTAAVAR